MLSAETVEDSDFFVARHGIALLRRMHPTAIVLGSLAASITVFLGPAWVMCYLALRDDRPARLLNSGDAIITSFLYLVAVPALFLACVRLPSLIADTFNDLEDNKILARPGRKLDTIPRYVQEVERWLSRPIWWRSSAAIVVLVALLGQLGMRSDPSSNTLWFYEYEWYKWVWLAATMVLGYLVAVTTLRGIVGAVALGWLLWTSDAAFLPMHKDGRGGFAPVGKFVIHAAFFLAIGAISGVIMSASALHRGDQQNAAVPFIYGVVFSLIAPTILAWPLFAGRRAMRRAAAAEIAEIREGYDQVASAGGDPRLARSAPPKKLPDILEEQSQLLRYQLAAQWSDAWPVGSPMLALSAIDLFAALFGPLITLPALMGLR